MESKLIMEFKEYLRNTPSNQVSQDWNNIEKMGFNGPLVHEYLAYLSDSCYYYYSPPTEQLVTINETNLTPTFSASFFLLKLQYESKCN